jgi:serine/threonine-protein kinase
MSSPADRTAGVSPPNPDGPSLSDGSAVSDGPSLDDGSAAQMRSGLHDDRVDHLIAEFLIAEEAGVDVSPEKFIAAHPSFAGPLREFFETRQDFAKLAGPGAGVNPLSAPRGEAFPSRGVIPGSGSSELKRTPTHDPMAETMAGSGKTVAIVTPNERKQFGDYELIEELGRGGMGVVYRAHQQGLDRVVALKMLREGRLASPADRERFHREAQILSRMDHPGIVPILDVGMLDGRDFFTMKWIDGGSLAVHVERLRSDLQAAAAIVADAADAVHYAHLRGILHRDLKPANILIDAQGHAHVTDFGLSQFIADESNLTNPGDIVGTPKYMSPEQAGGSTVLTTAADIYSLGAILYELITGRSPHVGATVRETLNSVVNDVPAAPRSVVPGLDPDLETICLRCLEKEERRRYLSAQEFADDLRRWIRGEPISARPVSRLERGMRWCGRHPYWTAAFFCSAFLFILGPFAALSVMRALDDRLTEAMAINNKYAARQVSYTVLRKLSDLSRKVEELAGDETLRKALQAGDLATVQSRVEQLQSDVDAWYVAVHGTSASAPFKNLMVLDAAGVALARGPHRDAWVGRDFSWRDYFRVVSGGRQPIRGTRGYLSRVYHSEIDGQYKFAISVPIAPLETHPEQALGVFVATIASTTTLDLPETEDDDHKIVLVSRFDPSRATNGGALTTNPPRNVILVHEAFRTPGKDATPIQNPELEKVLSDPRPGVHLAEDPGYIDPVTGAGWIATFARVESTPLAVILQTSREDASQLGGVLLRHLTLWSGFVICVCATAFAAAGWYRCRFRPHPVGRAPLSTGGSSGSSLPNPV